MVDFKEDERLNTLNHSCAHVMAQAVKHLYPHARFWVGPVVKEGFYYDIDLGDDVINDEAVEAITAAQSYSEIDVALSNAATEPSANCLADLAST